VCFVDFFREQWPDSAIAFLPQIDRSDVPASMTNREFMLYKAEIEAACLERVLFPVFSADHVLFRCVDNKGVTRPVIAMLHSWVADFQEQLALAGLIGQTGCALCCVEGDALLPDPVRADLGWLEHATCYILEPVQPRYNALYRLRGAR